MPLIEARGLQKSFDTRRGLVARLTRRENYLVRAVDGVDFAIERGETLGLIGESGCGKSTLGRVVLRLQEPTGGRILFDGEDITEAPADRLQLLRRRMQIIFQDPYASLNPRKTVEQIIGLPLRLQGVPRAQVRDRVVAMLERMGLRANQLNRFPHQFSGGQRQRIGIARALISDPDFVVCDEAVSALDVSVQAQILHLLEELRGALGLTFLFISHNLAVVGHVADRIAVMYLGEIVETGPAREILARPKHPYTQSLLAAVPQVDAPAGASRQRLRGDPPSPLSPPPGCRFHTRCPEAMPQCRTVRPVLTGPNPSTTGHAVACHLYPAVENP